MDSNSALAQQGKVKGLTLLLASKEHQSSLGLLGEEEELSSSSS